ncbi:hypothetical protein ACIA8C_13195 [Nocardia sp. NPDC051321]|uniref:hypothetical protein n=1 Tax=Nocardia sp. NPDC051321 TaxID=3364323 RepID=UPI0037B987A2
MSDDELQRIIREGAPFLEVLGYLSGREGRPITPMRFLWIFQHELGISFVESREILDCFDPGMNPLVDADQINERGLLLLNKARPDTDGGFSETSRE